MERQGQLVNLFLTTDADAFTASLDDVSGIEVHIFWFQFQVAAEVVVNLLHHACPLRIAGVCLALVHQDTFDDTVLLGFLCQCDQTLVGIVVVSLEHTFHPAWSFLDVSGNAVGKESLDVDTADGNVDDADLDVFGQRSHKRTSEPVGGSKSCVGTAEWGNGLGPLSHLTGRELVCCGVIYCRHPQESWSGTLQVLSFRTCGTFHVRLTEAEEDIKIRILRVRA